MNNARLSLLTHARLRLNKSTSTHASAGLRQPPPPKNNRQPHLPQTPPRPGLPPYSHLVNNATALPLLRVRPSTCSTLSGAVDLCGHVSRDAQFVLGHSPSEEQEEGAA
jgi:hypothetical protein